MHLNVWFDYERENLGTKLQVFVLVGPIIDYCLAFSVVIACLSFPLAFKLLEGNDRSPPEWFTWTPASLLKSKVIKLHMVAVCVTYCTTGQRLFAGIVLESIPVVSG